MNHHVTISASRLEIVRSAVSQGWETAAEISRRCSGVPTHAVSDCLRRLWNDGELERRWHTGTPQRIFQYRIKEASE